jgi:hypothetical protein
LKERLLLVQVNVRNSFSLSFDGNPKLIFDWQMWVIDCNSDKYLLVNIDMSSSQLAAGAWLGRVIAHDQNARYFLKQ